MTLFVSKDIQTTTGDPFLDAVVSMTDDNNTSYTGIKAIKNGDVFTAVKLVASDIATSPIQVITGGQVQQDDELTDLVNRKPNAKIDGWHFKFALAVNMLLNGNSFAEIVTDNTGVKSLELLTNSTVAMKEKTNGSIYYEIKEGNRSRILKPDSILHFKYFTTDGLTGVSPLNALADEIKIQKAGNKTLYNFFARGINGSGILKVNKSDLNAEAKKAIREAFEAANGSDDGNNALRTIIMDSSMDYSTLEVNTDVLKLINSTDWTTKQVAKVFGIPIERLGVENQHSNNVQSNIMYLQNTLIHYFRCFTSELEYKLGNQFKFNPEFLFEADPATMTENVVTQFKEGIIDRNEARSKLGYQIKEVE